jgi:hypothetical protein
VVSLTGIIMGFLLTPASRYDNQPVVELLDSFSHHLKRLLGDGAYNDAALQSYLQQYRALQLLAPTKGNQPPKRSKPAQRQLNRWRLIWSGKGDDVAITPSPKNRTGKFLYIRLKPFVPPV